MQMNFFSDKSNGVTNYVSTDSTRRVYREDRTEIAWYHRRGGFC